MSIMSKADMVEVENLSRSGMAGARCSSSVYFCSSSPPQSLRQGGLRAHVSNAKRVKAVKVIDRHENCGQIAHPRVAGARRGAASREILALCCKLTLWFVRNADDPSQAFLAAEEYMDSLHSIDLQSDNEMAHYFVATCLPRIIISLLKRR